MRVLARHPAMTLHVLGGIYGQALRLRLKGARWHAKPAAAPPARDAPPRRSRVSVRERAARRAVHALLGRAHGGTIELREGGASRTSARPPAAPPLHARIDVHDPAFHRALLSRRRRRRARLHGRPVGLRRPRRARTDRGARDARARPLAPAAAAADGAVAADHLAAAREHPRPRARADRRPLRPRQHALLALPRRDDDVLVARSSSAPTRRCTRRSSPSSTASAKRLQLRPGDRLLEIGTGWGGLALHAAAATARASRRRRSRASSTPTRAPRVRAAGLEDRVTVLLQDYRDLRGRYDKLVSIEMIEAVGWEHLDTYFAACSDAAGAARRDAAAGDRPSPPRLPRREGVDAASSTRSSSPAARCRRSPRSSARSPAAPTCARSRSTTSRRTTRARCAAGASASTTPGRSCAGSATTSASAACGTSTSPTAKPASASAASPTSSSCSPSPHYRAETVAPLASPAASPVRLDLVPEPVGLVLSD